MSAAATKMSTCSTMHPFLLLTWQEQYTTFTDDAADSIATLDQTTP